MSVSSVGSSSAYLQWQAYLQSTRSTSSHPSPQAAGDGDADDSASISPQGFAALMQSSRSTSSAPTTGGASGLGDDRAAQIGARIESRDPGLFKQLDADGDGTLTAQELKAGRDQMRTAHAAAIGQRINQTDPALFKAIDTNGDGTLGADEWKAAQSLLTGAAATSHEGSGTPEATSGTVPGAQADGVHHHRHHHHGGGAGGGPASQPPTTSDNATVGDPTTTDPLASLWSGQSDQAKLQANTMNDLLQQLFGAPNQR